MRIETFGKRYAVPKAPKIKVYATSDLFKDGRYEFFTGFASNVRADEVSFGD